MEVKKEVKKPLLLEHLGDHPTLRIISFLLENRLIDFSKKQIAEGAQISKVTLFKHWKKLESAGIVKVTRRFGKTKLHKLDIDNQIVKKLIDLDLALKTRIMQKQTEMKIESKEQNEERYREMAYV